jgi:hypothetical protein
MPYVQPRQGGVCGVGWIEEELMKNFRLTLLFALTGCPLVSDSEHAARIDVDSDGFVAHEYPGGVDCDDRDPDVGAAEVWFLDADGDGIGETGDGLLLCSPPSNFVRTTGDCNDTDAAVGPGFDEFCNGLDDNCNGVRDDGLDVSPAWMDSDGDGYGGDTGVDLHVDVEPDALARPVSPPTS